MSAFSNLINIGDVFTGIDSPFIDMSIISTSDHVITTAETIIWWIRYLSKGTVLYSKKEGPWLKKTQFCDMKSCFFVLDWLKLMFRTTSLTNPR